MSGRFGAHCFDRRVVGVRAVHMDLPSFMRAFTEENSYASVRADFIEQVRPLVASGAEVILPAGGLPMLLFSRERPFIIDGALVLNGIAVAVKAAEMALALRDLTGAVVSRRGTYAKASDACVAEYLQRRGGNDLANLKDELAAEMARLAQAMGLGRLR